MHQLHVIVNTLVALVLFQFPASFSSGNGDRPTLTLIHSYPLIQDRNFSYVELTCRSSLAADTCTNVSFQLNGTDVKRSFSEPGCINGSVRLVLTQRDEGEFTCLRDGATSNNNITLAAQPLFEQSSERTQWVWLNPFNTKASIRLVADIKPGVVRERYTAKWSQYFPATTLLKNITPDSTFDLAINVTTALNGSRYQLLVTINHNGSLEQTYMGDTIVIYVGMNYTSGNSPLTHAAIVSISFFGPLLFTAVIISLLLITIYLCYRYKCFQCDNIAKSKAIITFLYNRDTSECPSTEDVIPLSSHSSQSPGHSMNNVDVAEFHYVGLNNENMLLSTVIVNNDCQSDLLDNENTNDVSMPHISSTSAQTELYRNDGMAMRIPCAIPEVEEEDELLTSGEMAHVETAMELRKSSGVIRLLPSQERFPSNNIPDILDVTYNNISKQHSSSLAPETSKLTWNLTDLDSPLTYQTSDNLGYDDFGSCSQSATADSCDTRFGYRGYLPDKFCSYSASQISTAGGVSHTGLLEEYSEDASQTYAPKDAYSGDSGIGQSLSPEKSLPSRRISLTQEPPGYMDGKADTVDFVTKKLSRHWSVSDPKTVDRKHRYIKKTSVANAAGKGSAMKQHPPQEELLREHSSRVVATCSQPQPRVGTGGGYVDQLNLDPYHQAKPQRESSSRLVSQVPGRRKARIAHRGTQSRERLLTREDTNPLKTYSQSLLRRPKVSGETNNRPPIHKHHYLQPESQMCRSTAITDVNLSRRERIKIKSKSTLSKGDHHHHSLPLVCKYPTEDQHPCTMRVKEDSTERARDGTLTLKQPMCQPKPKVGSSPQCKEALIVPNCIRPTATLQECTSDGLVFEDKSNGFTLTIDKGAIAEGDKLTIDIGVALHGPFSYPNGTRPVSPVFWICVRENESYEFKKPVNITIQHFLNISSEDERARMGVSFMKASHIPNDKGKYSFHNVTESQLFKPKSQNGVIATAHFCYQCIVSNISEQTLRNSNFCLFGTLPDTFVYDRPMYVFFYVTFFLNACLETVRRQMAKSRELSHCKYTEVKTEFQFAQDVSPPSITIQCPPSLPGGWQLGIEFKKKITLKDIDFKSRDKDDLQFKEDEGIYPPHFRVVIDATCTIEKATAHLKFSGTANDLVFDMHLVPPTLTIGSQSLSQTSPFVYHPPNPTHLPPLTMKQLTNLVISKIPGMWKYFGIELEVPESEHNFETYPSHDAKECFLKVIMSWKRRGQPDYTWETVLDVLQSENLSEKRLAMDVRSKLMSRHTQSPYYQQAPALSCPDH